MIKVSTPNRGTVCHGDIKDKNFHRSVDYYKDRMFKFDAWSINPEALEIIKKKKVRNLIYTTRTNTYTISLEDAIKYGFEDTFRGGRTIYIPLKHWVKERIKSLDNPEDFSKLVL